MQKQQRESFKRKQREKNLIQPKEDKTSDANGKEYDPEK